MLDGPNHGRRVIRESHETFLGEVVAFAVEGQEPHGNNEAKEF